MTLKDATILVVDDEPALREIVSAWFARVGCHVFTAANGEEGLAHLKAASVNLIVTDIRMPVLDGISMLYRARAEGLDIPAVIFVSGYSDITPRQAFDLGVEALLEKPFLREDLLQAAQRSLASRDELWRTGRDQSCRRVLRQYFDSVDTAVRDRKIALGRGGLCINAEPLPEGPIDLELQFAADALVLSGQGMIRWVAPAEKLMGVEITSIDDPVRARAVQLTAGHQPFIPGAVG